MDCKEIQPVHSEGDQPWDFRCLELYQAIPALKGIFDPANFVQCGVDTLKAWELLQEYIYYMHIKDAKADGMIVPAGNGIGNIRELAKRYIARGGKHFTMEPHLMEFDGLKGLERENEQSVISAFCFKDNNEAFDAGCLAFKKLI